MGCTSARAREASAPHRSFDNGRDGNLVGEGTKRRTAANEYGVAVGVWPSLSQVDHNRLAKLLRQRQLRLAFALSRDANEYKPIRDALAHTALLTDKAKQKLTGEFDYSDTSLVIPYHFFADRKFQAYFWQVNKSS